MNKLADFLLWFPFISFKFTLLAAPFSIGIYKILPLYFKFPLLLSPSLVASLVCALAFSVHFYMRTERRLLINFYPVISCYHVPPGAKYLVLISTSFGLVWSSLNKHTLENFLLLLFCILEC